MYSGMAKLTVGETVCFSLVLQIRDIEGLGHLAHLRVLNLAGNEITCVSNLSALPALTELNLRRNRITLVVGLHHSLVPRT